MSTLAVSELPDLKRHSSHVLGSTHSLQMCGIYAMPNHTEMINLEIRGDRAHLKLVGNSVDDSIPVRQFHHSITTLVLTSHPQPAGFRFSDSLPEISGNVGNRHGANDNILDCGLSYDILSQSGVPASSVKALREAKLNWHCFDGVFLLKAGWMLSGCSPDYSRLNLSHGGH